MNRPRFFTWGSVLAGLLAAVAYTQPALYYSNQNQYFLHGLAQAGFGELRSDWLANTLDPTPLFSHAVAWAYPLGTWTYHAAFFGLVWLYFLSLWGIVVGSGLAPTTCVGQLAWWAVLMLTHSGAVRAASVALTGVDYPWYLQVGVANQYLLGAGLQPSVFGVLLLTALAAYLHDRPKLTGFLAALACAWHATYLLHAGLLILVLMYQDCTRKRYRAALQMGIFALIFTIPTIWYTIYHFLELSRSYDQAMQIIAWQRIPHHCDLNRWFDGMAAGQVVFALAGVVALFGTPLGRPLFLTSLAALGLTLWQFWRNDAAVALLFPWRISALLVPMTLAVLGGQLFIKLEGLACFVRFRWLFFSVIVLTLAGTGFVYYSGRYYPVSPLEEPLFQFVRQQRQPGQVYLISAKFPKPPSRRGTSSASFVPLNQSSSAIFELQRFRLETGVPVFVDFKSIPYQHLEVHEWHRRVTQVERWFTLQNWTTVEMQVNFQQYGLTHVVLQSGHGKKLPFPKPIYRDDAFEVYQLLPPDR